MLFGRRDETRGSQDIVSGDGAVGSAGAREVKRLSFATAEAANGRILLRLGRRRLLRVARLLRCSRLLSHRLFRFGFHVECPYHWRPNHMPPHNGCAHVELLPNEKY